MAIGRDQFEFLEVKKPPRRRRKLMRSNAKDEIEKSYKGELFDFVQCEAGYQHSLLLNSQGQVFAFGEGLRGQLGTNSREMHLDHPHEITFPKIKV